MAEREEAKMASANNARSGEKNATGGTSGTKRAPTGRENQTALGKRATEKAGYREEIHRYLETETGQKRLRQAISETKPKAVRVSSLSGGSPEEKPSEEVAELVQRGEVKKGENGTYRYTLRGEAIRRIDPDGARTPDESAPKTRFIWPVEGGRITSPYGPRKSVRTKNGAMSSSYHPSIDIGAPEGTPIRSVASGTVTYAGFVNGYGYTVEVTHEDGSVAKYHHMKSPTPLAVGTKVAQGAEVGEVGETGNSTGPHLDITLVIDGKTVDPEKHLGRDAPEAAAGGNTGQPSGEKKKETVSAVIASRVERSTANASGGQKKTAASKSGGASESVGTGKNGKTAASGGVQASTTLFHTRYAPPFEEEPETKTALPGAPLPWGDLFSGEDGGSFLRYPSVLDFYRALIGRLGQADSKKEDLADDPDSPAHEIQTAHIKLIKALFGGILDAQDGKQTENTDNDSEQ